MILLSLKLNHFKQYQELELDFKEGLAGIVGRNGAGKSSVFSGVLLCLFGEVAKLDKKYFRSSWATTKDPVSLTLQFEVKGKRYRVLREFRGKALTHSAQLFDQKDTALATGVKPVADAISELIGMDKDSFTRSIFSGQKELGEISNTQGEERRKMIRKMVGLDKLDKIQSIIREDKNKIKNQIKGQENLLYDEAEIKGFEKELKAQKKNLEGIEKKAAKIKKQLEEKQKQYLSAQKAFELENQKYKQHNDFLHEYNKYEAGVESLTARSNDLKQQLEALKETEKELKKQSPQIKTFEKQKVELLKVEATKEAYEQIAGIKQKQQHYQTQLTDIQAITKQVQVEIKPLSELEKQLQQLGKALLNEQENISKSEQNLVQLNNALGAIQGKISDRNNSIQNISQLGKEAECPTCFQPLLNTYDQTIARLQSDIKKYEDQELNKIQTDIKKAKTQVEKLKTVQQKNKTTEGQLNTQIQVLSEKNKQLAARINEAKKIQEFNKQLEAQIKSIGKVDFKPEHYQKLKTAIQAFEPQYIKYRSQMDDLAKVPEYKKKLANLQERIKNGKAAVKEQSKKIKQLGFKENKYTQAQEKQRKAEEERDSIQAALAENKEELFELKAEIQNIENDLANNEKVLKVIKTQRDEFQQLEALDLLFTKFKTNILERVKPIISHHASSLFNQITKGRYESIIVDNNFEFHIFDNGDYYPITRFSGGEIDLANLCLRIGISKAIADLSGSSAANSILCFDEIFGSQDEERRFEILNALDLLKEQYRQIYIISHIESIKDHFPNILQVRKTPTGSAANWT